MEYLGTVIASVGSIQRELSRRIGSAKADFALLSKLWGHSALTWPHKLRIFSALVESKLYYALGACVLTKADERRLNGFQNRCIRQILNIKPAFVSRVSNVEVLSRAKYKSASDILGERQQSLMRKVLRATAGHPLRTCCFVGSTTYPLNDFYVRKLGRPYNEWVKHVTSVP